VRVVHPRLFRAFATRLSSRARTVGETKYIGVARATRRARGHRDGRGVVSRADAAMARATVTRRHADQRLCRDS
jgi:hypothetical protein